MRSTILTILAAAALLHAAPVVGGPAPQDSTLFDEYRLFCRLGRKERDEYQVIRLFMSERQKQEYLCTGEWWQRRLWVERFWLDLDPTPTTKKNEKKLEVEERVKLARELFPAPDDPGWDDRGYTFIRFGVPNYWNRIWATVSGGALNMPGEIWHYSAPETLLKFTDHELDGIYTADYFDPDHGMWIPTEYDPGFRSSSKKRLDDLAMMANPFRGSKSPGSTSDPDFDVQMERDDLPDKVEMLCERYGLEGYWPTGDENRYFLFPDLDLNMIAYFDISAFMKGSNSTRTEITFEVPGSELSFTGTEGGLRSEVELRVLVRDMDMKEVTSSSEVFRMGIEGEVDPKEYYMLGQSAVTLPEGEYRFWIEVVDRSKERRGTFKTVRNVEDYSGRLSISDIQFAKTIRESDVPSRYRKGDIIVIPHPLHLYKKGFPLTFYFEIYGLDTDSEDFAFYAVEYEIEPTERKRWGPIYKDIETVITSKFNTSGFGSTQPQRLEIDTDELWKGRFKLKVTVTDRRTREAAVKETFFAILE